MTKYIVGTYYNGEDFTNLLSNRLISEIEKETKNHKTEIQVINNKNFIVVRGYTTHKEPINISQLFISYYNELFGANMVFNVVDLIEYNTSPDTSYIYLNKTYYKDKMFDSLRYKSSEDSMNGKDYRYTANTDISLVLMEGDIKEDDLKQYFENYSFYKITKPVSTYYSNLNYGRNLRSSKLFNFYFNYITHNIFERNLCKDLEISFFTDAKFEDINWENIKLEVNSNSLITSNEWLKSMILDVFTFEPEEIIQRWDLENYNFENEVTRVRKSIWEIRDKTGEMILI
jgi:hypothetical protein